MASDTWFRPVSARPLAGLRVGLPLLLLVHLVWLSERSPLASWQSGNHSLGAHGPAARSLGARPPNPGQGLSAPRDQRAHRHHPSALGLCRKPARARSGISHPALGVSGVGPSPQPRDERFCFFLWRGSVGQYVPLLSPCSFRPGAPGRSRLVRPPPPRGDDSRRLSEGDASPPLRDLSRRRFRSRPWGDSGGTARPSGRRSLSPPFSTFDLSWLARYPWIPMLAGWGTLVVEIGYAFLIWPRRTRKVWCIATIGLHLGIGLFMGLVFFSSVMILLTVLSLSDSRRSPGGTVQERAVA